MEGLLEIVFRVGLASVPGFAPVGASAADYADHCWGSAPLPEVLAHHAEHWPTITAEKQFAPLLDLERFRAAELVDLARDSGATAISIASVDRIPAVHWVADRLADAALERGPRWVAGGVHALAGRRRVVERFLPAAPPRGGWVLHTALGPSFGWNRAETDRDLLDPAGFLDRLLAAAARGGGVVLDVPMRGDGTVPDAHAATMRLVGSWLARHADAFDGTGPFDVWGDDEVRYLARATPGDPGRRDVFVLDLRREPRRVIGHFSPHRYPVDDVVGLGPLDGHVTWSQDGAGLHLGHDAGTAPLDDPDVAHHLPTVVRLTVRDRRLVRLPVQGQRTPGRVTVGPRAYGTIGEALAEARPGDVVEVGAGRSGRHHEDLPLVVPAGVVLRGVAAGEPDPSAPLGLAAADDGTVIDLDGVGPDTPAVRLAGPGAALEHVTVARPPAPNGGSGGASPVAVTVDGADGARVEHCDLAGDLVLHASADVTVSWNRLRLGGVHATGCERLTVTGNRQRGTHRGVGVSVVEGQGHRVDGNHLADDHTAVHLRGVADSVVSGNDATGHWCALHLDRTQRTQAVANRVRGMRGVAVTGGEAALVATNVADHTDTGVLLDGDTQLAEVTGNRFEGCRVGVLAWSHHGTTVSGNRA